MIELTDAQIIEAQPYADECEIRRQKIKVIKTRAAHICTGVPGEEIPEHEFPAGTRARVETAIVDGEWSRYYTCIDCLVKYATIEPWAFGIHTEDADEDA